MEIPEGGAEGVIVTQGGRFGGWGLLVLDGKPMFAYAFSNQDGYLYPDQNKYKTRIAAAEQLAPGKHTDRFRLRLRWRRHRQGGEWNAHVSMAGRLPRVASSSTSPIRFSLDESFDVGQDTGTPVIDEYDAKMPFKFSGTLNKVEIDLGADGLTPEKHGELSDSNGNMHAGAVTVPACSHWEFAGGTGSRNENVRLTICRDRLHRPKKAQAQ